LALQLVHVAIHAVEPIEQRAQIAIILRLRPSNRERAAPPYRESADQGGSEHDHAHRFKP